MMAEVLSSLVIKKAFFMLCILYLMLLSFVLRLESESPQSYIHEYQTQVESFKGESQHLHCSKFSTNSSVLQNLLCLIKQF